MRYYVTIGERTFEVTLDDEGMAVDGARVQADLRPVPGTPMHHLLLDGQSYLLHAASGRAGEWVLHANGARYDTEVVDERTRAIRALTSSAAGPRGPKPVRAPMPGLVVRLLVEPGQRVEAGQGVAIVEAMKMENELRAPRAGTVAAVNVAEGQSVDAHAVLVVIE